MTIESKPAYEWVGVAVDVLVVFLGAWMIASGWTGFGSTVVLVGVIGLVVSTVRLWRMARRRADG